jgi:hypothetical protein
MKLMYCQLYSLFNCLLNKALYLGLDSNENTYFLLFEFRVDKISLFNLGLDVIS